jgi:phospholipid transport system transporter-binding protein
MTVSAAASAQILPLSGALTMDSVRRQLPAGRELARAGSVIVDFSAVSEADSAALALLFDWMRTARSAGHEIATRALPGGLRSLADLYGVAELLPPEA